MDNFEYITFKSELDQLHDGKANGIRIRDKCDLYEYGQKSIKSLLNLKKIRAHQKKTRNILKNCKEITDQKDVNNESFDFYNNLFKSYKTRAKHEFAQFLSLIQIPRLTEQHSATMMNKMLEKNLLLM